MQYAPLQPLTTAVLDVVSLSPRTAPVLSRKHVAVVANAPVLRRTLGCISRDLGYRVTEMPAINFQTDDLPEVIVIDDDVLGDQASAMFDHLARDAHTARIPVVVACNAHDDDAISRALDLGATDVITKPMEAVMLRARLGAALRLKSLQDDLRRLALSDPLTGLLNQATFEGRVRDEISRSRRHLHDLTIAMVDIDRFAAINLRHGHEAADRIIAEVAKCIHDNLRLSDIMGAIHGPCFCVLLPETNLVGARVTLGRIVRAVAEKRFGGAETPTRLTVSVGLVDVSSSTCNEPDYLLGLAKDALMDAKVCGRNRIAGTPAA